MTEQAVTIKITGIKCDNTECDYRDDKVNRENYLEYINKQCPECGSILLTQEDFDAVLLLEGAVINVNLYMPENLLDDSETIFDIEMNGTGVMDMKERKD